MSDAPEDAVYIGRPSEWGNPYMIGVHVATRAAALAKFEAFLDENPDIGTAWAQDAGDTLIRAMKARYAATKRGREVQPLRPLRPVLLKIHDVLS